MAEMKPVKMTENQPPSITDLRRRLKLGPTDGEFKVEGGKIIGIDLEGTGVKDIAPLKGLPLIELRLNFTGVQDISPLENMPLQYLNLQKTRVTDISVVHTLKDLKILWLNDTKVADLKPLKGLTLESLDISGTPVTDLTPLSGMQSLQRLNLTRSAVTDLTPLQGLHLQRLIFQPRKITRGLQVVRQMPTLVHLHTYFPPDGRFLRPAQFWALYDMGQLPQEP